MVPIKSMLPAGVQFLLAKRKQKQKASAVNAAYDPTRAAGLTARVVVALFAQASPTLCPHLPLLPALLCPTLPYPTPPCLVCAVCVCGDTPRYEPDTVKPGEGVVDVKIIAGELENSSFESDQWRRKRRGLRRYIQLPVDLRGNIRFAARDTMSVHVWYLPGPRDQSPIAELKLVRLQHLYVGL